MTGSWDSVYRLFAYLLSDIGIADSHGYPPFGFFCQWDDLMAEGMQQMFV